MTRSILRGARLPEGFFKFDLKDTLRLIVWIIISSFMLGGIYAQRKADISRLESGAHATKDQVAAVSKRVDALAETLAAKAQTDAAIAVSLEGIRTELRYVNEKIDVLRQDVRARGRAP